MPHPAPDQEPAFFTPPRTASAAEDQRKPTIAGLSRALGIVEGHQEVLAVRVAVAEKAAADARAFAQNLDTGGGSGMGLATACILAALALYVALAGYYGLPMPTFIHAAPGVG